ncbi:hypothetical protein G1K53_12645, partial [Tenacibaculum finnmarkense]
GNLRITAPGSSWITGKTGTGGLTSSTQLTNSTYHPLIRQKTASGHFINLGGLGDYFGFFGYDKNRTVNGYDHSMIMNLNTGNVGIGKNPSAKLDVNGNLRITAPGSSWITGKTGTGGLTSSTQLTNSTYHPLIRQKTASGHFINLGGLGDYFGFFGYDKNRTANGYDHSMVMNLNTGNIGIGTTNTGSHKLAVEGSIGAREIKVEANGWSDFVFYDDYKLPTLKEVENHIKEKGHLKDIPSEKEVEKNGISLGEMDAKLLRKIEELTLYTIEQEKKINNLEKNNKLLKSLVSQLASLKVDIEKLKTEK